jgi:hypothetical protein
MLPPHHQNIGQNQDSKIGKRSFVIVAQLKSKFDSGGN